MTEAISSTFSDAPSSSSSSSQLSDTPQRSARFWFDDGSIVLQVQSQQLKVHRTLISRHSPYISALLEAVSQRTDDLRVLAISADRGVSLNDTEALMRHLYHDQLLTRDAPFHHIAAILRVSSPRQLDYPLLHECALAIFVGMFPEGPLPFIHPPCQQEALALATELNIVSTRNAILYGIMTTIDFDASPPSKPEDMDTEMLGWSSHPPQHTIAPTDARSEGPHCAQKEAACAHKPLQLSARDTELCTHLMTQIIEHFTPSLFTPAATPHMACTDVFANAWMSRIIQPALDSGGVYKPLETLELMKAVDWRGLGLCAHCVQEKREEWTQEQDKIWRLVMDTWLE